MTKDQESGGAPLEQLPDEALCRLIREQDRPAEEVLAARYHRVVRSCARPYFLAGGDSEDLMQEGMFGLIKAMREYDPDRDASFRTFAETCIRHRLYSVVKAAAGGKHAPLNQSVPLNPSLFEGSADRQGEGCQPAGECPQAAVRIRGHDFRVLSGRSYLP